MKFYALAALLIALPAVGSVAVKRSNQAKKIDVAIVREPLSSAVKALEPYLPHPVQLLINRESLATFSARHVDPEAALHAVALSAGVELIVENDRYWLRDRSDAAVTLDVKDEDIHAILKSMKTQCAIKNLVIDPGVQGKGTFLFDKVPCRKAFDIVLRTMGLASVDYGNSVVSVGVRKR